MPYILDIATAVPEHSVSKEELVEFYCNTLEKEIAESNRKKLRLISEKTHIENRYSCIPDFNGKTAELFTDGDYNPAVEKRLEMFNLKSTALGRSAIEKLFSQTKLSADKITHFITVTCTGISAPGLEFLLAEELDLLHTEKLGINYLGCYAALKALKHAQYIAKADPNACVLIVCVELCSLHFMPSVEDEDVLSNLLFADGAAATIVCGDGYLSEKKVPVLAIDNIGSAYIPGTMDLMTWNVSSKAFRMYLSKHIVDAIGSSIEPVVKSFLQCDPDDIDLWAIHPGGVRIVDAVKKSLNLSNDAVRDSLNVLQNYGNMSSPTVLFILSEMLNTIRNENFVESKKIFTCAFGPGLNIEMLKLSSTIPAVTRGKTENRNAVSISV
jgi:predicted naringenin-chalcone synthase